MGLILSESASSAPRTPVPEGAHAAICIGVIDLGIQDGGNYGPKPKVMLRFELPDVTTERDGKQVPAVLRRDFTFSMNEKATLRAFLESWRGRKFATDNLRTFDLSTVIGKPCLLNVVHEVKGDRTYDNIDRAIPLPEAMRKALPAKTFYEPLVFDRDRSDAREVLAKLPEWIVEKITDAIDPADAHSGHDARTPPTAAYATDDIPF